jgi:hypothetical protein
MRGVEVRGVEVRVVEMNWGGGVRRWRVWVDLPCVTMTGR